MTEGLENTAAPALSRGTTLAMALTAGVAVANIYYNQPMLGVIEQEFPDSTVAGFVPTATQLGYAAGIMMLVPLGDIVERRRLIIIQLILLALAMVGAAIAPGPWSLIASLLVVGVAASAVQQIIPFAASLSAPEKRGATIGMVMSGLFCGILFSRTLAGFVAEHYGWRDMFWFALPLNLAMAALMAAVLPRHRPQTRIGYLALLRSMETLWREEAVLRRATMIQAALFASFSTFWTILALRLQEPDLNLGADAAGLFGIIGVAGILAAPLAGRLADRRGPHLAIGGGAVVALSSWLAFGLWNTIAGLVVGVILLDFGIQSVLISNQHQVLSLRPEARNRLNTLFFGLVFAGGATGSAGATLAWSLGGWQAVCGFGGFLTVVALAVHVMGRRAVSGEAVAGY